MQPKQPHKWKAEATAHFLEAAVELADDVCLVPHKMRRYACTLIRDKMVEKGSPEVSIDVVRSKFNTFLANWRGYNELKLRFGSCFNPVTATFDAPQDWWDELVLSLLPLYSLYKWDAAPRVASTSGSLPRLVLLPGEFSSPQWCF